MSRQSPWHDYGAAGRRAGIWWRARLLNRLQAASPPPGSLGAQSQRSIFLIALLLTFLFSPSALAAGSKSDSAAPSSRVYLPAVCVPATTPVTAHQVYLPLLSYRPAPAYSCPTSSTAHWHAMPPTQRFISGAARSPDLNMNVRGWYRVGEFLGFVRYDAPDPPDFVHPLYLSAIAGGDATSFTATYQLNEWDWLGCDCAVPRPRLPYPVTLLGLRTTPGQPLHIARRDLDIDPGGFIAMVMYADAGQLVLKYTAEDRIDTGYLVHLTNVCVDPNLVALYEQLNAAGRLWLPGVDNDSIVATALAGEARVAVRDSGSFLDPRSWQDWWQDRPPP